MTELKLSRELDNSGERAAACGRATPQCCVSFSSLVCAGLKGSGIFHSHRRSCESEAALSLEVGNVRAGQTRAHHCGTAGTQGSTALGKMDGPPRRRAQTFGLMTHSTAVSGFCVCKTTQHGKASNMKQVKLDLRCWTTFFTSGHSDGLCIHACRGVRVCSSSCEHKCTKSAYDDSQVPPDGDSEMCSL